MSVYALTNHNLAHRLEKIRIMELKDWQSHHKILDIGKNIVPHFMILDQE
jgi:hypothetical protein